VQTKRAGYFAVNDFSARAVKRTARASSILS